jgi:hypothetical protein
VIGIPWEDAFAIGGQQAGRRKMVAGREQTVGFGQGLLNRREFVIIGQPGNHDCHFKRTTPMCAGYLIWVKWHQSNGAYHALV